MTKERKEKMEHKDKKKKQKTENTKRKTKQQQQQKPKNKLFASELILSTPKQHSKRKKGSEKRKDGREELLFVGVETVVGVSKILIILILGF